MVRKTLSGSNQESWSRLASVARREGVRGLLQRLETWMKTNIWYYGHHMVMYEIKPETPLPSVDFAGQPEPVLTLRLLAPDHEQSITDLVRIYRIPATREGVLARMRADERCYTCSVDGQMVGYVWVLLSGAVKEYGDTLFTLKDDEVYIHDAYVLPAMRGHGIYPWMKALASREIAEETGKNKVISYIRRKNYSSINASRKLGGWKIGHIGCLRLHKRRFWFRFPHRPVPL